MGLLTNEDKEKVKRAVPKGSNKIIDLTVAKLYIAYPNPDEYIDTGLSGAVVLVEDLVGKTFFIKIVDIEGQRGVIWDQELFVNFEYNKDRTFFHSFELEEFYCGLLFEDVTEANHFFKRVTNKEKYCSKDTLKNKNATIAKNKAVLSAEAEANSKLQGPRGFNNIDYNDPNNAQKIRRAKTVLYYNDLPPPEWRELYLVLEEQEGITESMIADNKQFIKEFIKENGFTNLIGLEPPIPRKYKPVTNSASTGALNNSNRVSSISSYTKNKKAPPPPPPTAGNPLSEASSEIASVSVPASQSPTPPPLPADPTVAPSTNKTPERKYRLPPQPSFMGEGLNTIPAVNTNVSGSASTPYQQSKLQESYHQYHQEQTNAVRSLVPPPPLPPKISPTATPTSNTTSMYYSPPVPPSRDNHISAPPFMQNTVPVSAPLAPGPSLPPRVPLQTRTIPAPPPQRHQAPPPPPSRKAGGPAPPPPPSRRSVPAVPGRYSQPMSLPGQQ